MVEMEWKIRLKHSNGVDEIEIIGIGNDPHKPVEIIPKVRGSMANRIYKKILEEVRRGHRPILYNIQSPDDMYLYTYYIGSVADEDSNWKYESNLPKLQDPREEHEDDSVLII